MSIKKIEKLGDELEITIRVKLDKTSMLQSEENIEEALNEAGVLASEHALSEFDTDGRPIEVDGLILTSKGQQKKSTKDSIES